jgi:thiol-disulfide isomerase/thioredoxin
MKRIYKTLTFVAAGAMMLTACDDVKEGDRYIEMEEITSDRAVLLEDFTGQFCINCPDAHEVMEQLVEQYGEDKVIPVSIHCGDFGVSVNNTNFDNKYIGLMTEEGNSICAAYGITEWPMGVINMGSPMTYDLWASAVYKALSEPTDVTIEATADYDALSGSDNGEISITAKILSGSERTANVQFWITEDSIVALQRSTAGFNAEYVHNNVFRAQVFDGRKGIEQKFEKDVYTEVSGKIAARYTEKERWDVHNLHVVAFVSDGSGVLQVVKVPVNIKSEIVN